MFRNYIKVALRNLVKQKFYASINVLGLAVGIASSLLIALFVVNEYSYDKFHSKGDRIFRVVLNGRLSGNEFKAPVAPAPFARTLVKEFDDVEGTLRMQPLRNEAVRYEDKVYNERNAFWVDSSFFEIFDFKLLKGDPAKALNNKYSVVLSEDLANRYFGNGDPLGKGLVIGDLDSAYIVTGVIENCPANSHFKYSMLLSMNSNPNFEFEAEHWINNNYYTYVLLKDKNKAGYVQKQFDRILDKYVAPQMISILGIVPEELIGSGNSFGYYLQALEDIHLRSSLDVEIERNGNVEYVYILVALGVFIVLLACINFMNLATARSAIRAKEVGVRKALGSERSNLIVQFLVESLVYCILSTALAVLLLDAVLPYFNIISGKNLHISMVLDPFIILFLIVLILFVGLLSGSYPAFYLTSFNAVEVLKGKIRTGMRSWILRSALVVFQFFISASLTICTLVVYKQLNFIKEKEPGFDKENIVIINNAQQLGDHFDVFKEEVRNFSDVANVSSSSGLPADPYYNNTTFRPENSKQDRMISFYWADYDHVNTLNMQMASGRYFSEDFPMDSLAVVLNESAVAYLGYENAENKTVRFFGNAKGESLKIIGVIKDFHFESFDKPIRPLAILFRPRTSKFLVKFHPGNPNMQLNKLREKWEQYTNKEPFEYAFLDQKFNIIYQSEERLSEVFAIFTTLSILVACMGLLGLAAYTVEQRNKEIGVRKVLGASFFDIIIMMSREFTKLVFIAYIIAVPVSYFAMKKWLEGFAFKTDLDAELFIVSGLLVTFIAWLTVSFQSAKAALESPVKSLKSND